MPRRIVLTLCVALALVGWVAGQQSTPKLTPEQQEKLKERDRLAAEANKLKAAGKPAEAIAAMEKSVALHRELLGKDDPAVVNALNFLAGLHESRADFPAARKARREVLDILTKDRGAEHWQATDARLALVHVDQLEKVSPADRQRLAEAGQMNQRVVQLFKQGEARKAVALAQEALAVRKQLLGEKHPDYATSLNNLAGLYESQGDYARAEPLFRQALEIRKQALGEKHPAYAMSLDNLASLYQSQGDYAPAEPLYRQALEVVKQALGEKHPDYATSLNNLASLYQSQGDYARAEPLSRQALEIRKQALGEKHPDYAASLNNLASLYQLQGDYARAEPLFRQALEIRKQALGEKHPDYATSLNNLAGLYKSQGDYARAEPLYRQALEIRKQALGEKHPDYATSLINLAGLYKSQGDYARAEPFFRQALEINKQSLGDKHPHYAASLNNLAGLYQLQGDYARAEPLYRQALEVYKQALGEKHPHYAASLNNLAVLYQLQGDYARAEPLYRQALEVYKQALGEKHPHYATSLNNLAGLYKSQGDYARAEPLSRQALEVYKQALGEKHPDYATSLNNLAMLYQAQGDHARAEPLYRQALEVYKQALGEKHPDYARSLNNLASLYQSQGDYARAEPLSRQALEIRKQALGEKHPDYATSLSIHAMLYRAQGDHARAEPVARQSLAITRQLLDLTAAVQSERQQLRMSEQLRHRLDMFLSLAFAAPLSADESFAAALAWKGAVFARQQQLDRGDLKLAPLFADLRSNASRLSTLLTATPDPKQRDAFNRQIAVLSEDKERLERELIKQSPAFRQEQELARLTPAELQKALPAGAVLIDLLEYTHSTPDLKDKGKWKTERHLAAFIVKASRERERPEGSIVALDLGPTAPIAAAVQQWRQTVAKRTRPVMDDADPALTLRKLLWQPLEPHLKDVKTVLVAPDGPVAFLPLGALPGAKPDRYLIEDFAIVVIPVPQRLPALVGSPVAYAPGSPSLLVVGDVAYGAEAGRAEPDGSRGLAIVAAPGEQNQRPQWGLLPGTGPEAEAVRKLFAARFKDGKTQVLAAGAATEAAFRQQAPQHRYLHLATHGFFADAKLRSALLPSEKLLDVQSFGREGFIGHHPGLLSGLVLAGANRPIQPDQDDGILTAQEVGQADLRGVDLAVLSACETGLGAVAGGEGVLGLQRAFQLAGARSTITSLWKVDDDATRQLMERFYSNLWQKKMSKLEALREAQLWMLREGKRGPALDPKQGDRVPPFYWAAFVLSGDWR